MIDSNKIYLFFISFQGYMVRREVYNRESRSVYFTMAFAGIAFMAAAVVGLAVFKRRSARSPHSQVFLFTSRLKNKKSYSLLRHKLFNRSRRKKNGTVSPEK